MFRFKRMTGTMTDLSWPDEPGTWVGQDGVEYDVVISIESDTVSYVTLVLGISDQCVRAAYRISSCLH